MQTKYDLYSQDYYRHSFETFARMRRDDPVIRLPGFDGETPIWFVTRYKDVEALLKDDKTFVLDYHLAYTPEELKASGWREDPVWETVNKHLLTMEGENHRRLRSLVGKAFTPPMIAAMRGRIQEIASDLIGSLQERHQMDLVDAYAFPLPITVIAELLGVPYEDRFKFREWSGAVVAVSATPDEWQQRMGLLLEFVGYLRDLFEERREHPRSDLISALIQAEEAGDRLSTQELFSMVVLLIVAGHETTVTLIGNAVKALLAHPAVMQRLIEHPDDMPRAVEEFLRYDPPVERALNRWAVKDTTIGGVAIQRSEMIIPVLGSANHDESVFPDAERLDIDRDNRNHLAFGKGVHYCLGAPLARLEAEIALNTLLRRLPDLEIDCPPDELEYRPVPLFHSLKHLPVRW